MRHDRLSAQGLSDSAEIMCPCCPFSWVFIRPEQAQALERMLIQQQIMQQQQQHQHRQVTHFPCFWEPSARAHTSCDLPGGHVITTIVMMVFTLMLRLTDAEGTARARAVLPAGIQAPCACAPAQQPAACACAGAIAESRQTAERSQAQVPGVSQRSMPAAAHARIKALPMLPN